MNNKIKALVDKISELELKTSEELEEFRLNYLSKKGEITKLFPILKMFPMN